jgi:MSHA biogenesis protein MshI
LPGTAAVTLYPDGICLVHIALPAEAGARPRVIAREFRNYNVGQSPREALAEFAREFTLGRCRCSTLLDESEYKLVATPYPEVAADEVKNAIRWRVKDFIDFHINEATIETLELPDTGSGVPKEIYAVVARSNAIAERMQTMQEAGVDLEIVDIPEMALRNIAMLLPEDNDGMAFLSLQARAGLITLTRQGQIFLSRPIAIGLESLQGFGDPMMYFDQVLLDIQRSLDYYESHFRQAAIRNLVMAPLQSDAPGLFEYLTANLNLPVRQLDLSGLLDSDEPMSLAWQAKYLTTIGAALRGED